MTHAVHEHWFESHDTTLYAVEGGPPTATPLVFLHGGLADHRAALQWFGDLRAELRLITPDLRGAGRSHDAGPLSWDRLTDDIVALLDHLGLGRAVVGGTSMGSGVALRFALRWPTRCRGLVVASPVFAGVDPGLSAAARAATQIMHEHALRARAHGIEALLPLFDALPAEMRARANAMVMSFDPASVLATTELLASDRPPFAQFAELARIEVPSLIIAGNDQQHPPELGPLYASHMRDVRLVEPGTDPLAAIMAFCRALA